MDESIQNISNILSEIKEENFNYDYDSSGNLEENEETYEISLMGKDSTTYAYQVLFNKQVQNSCDFISLLKNIILNYKTKLKNNFDINYVNKLFSTTDKFLFLLIYKLSELDSIDNKYKINLLINNITKNLLNVEYYNNMSIVIDDIKNKKWNREELDELTKKIELTIKNFSIQYSITTSIQELQNIKINNQEIPQDELKDKYLKKLNEIILSFTELYGDNIECKINDTLNLNSFEEYQEFHTKFIDTIHKKQNNILKSDMDLIDRNISGFENGRFYTIAGEPGSGKSALLLNIANNCTKFLKENEYIIYYTMENAVYENYQRIICMNHNISKDKIEMLNEIELTKIYEKIKKIKMFYYGSNSITVDNLILNIEKYLQKEDSLVCRGIFIDYINLFKMDNKRELRHNISDICKSLKRLSVSCNCPVISATQLNKSSYDQNPTMRSIGESAGVPENSDGVFLLSREKDNEEILNLNLVKNRNGRTSSFQLSFKKEYFLITSERLHSDNFIKQKEKENELIYNTFNVESFLNN